MKYRLLLCIFLPNLLFAQKVDLDRFYFDVNYQRLPTEYVPLDARTYGFMVSLGQVFNAFTNETEAHDKLFISGWKKVESNPTVGASVVLEDFVERKVQRTSRVEEQKDKNGKLISSTTFYRMVVDYSFIGNVSVKGPFTPVKPSVKQLEEQKKKEESVTTNRFLKNAVISKPDDANVTSNPLFWKYNENVQYLGPESTDPKKVQEDFDNNRVNILDAKMREKYGAVLGSINYRLNNLYGYGPISDREMLWIMDSKGEEGNVQMEAIQAVKVIFAQMKANQSLDEIKSNLEPLVEYFQSLKKKYSSDDKWARKIRYSSFYNLSKIYLMIDEPERAIKEAEGLISNDYDVKDGRSLIDAGEKLLADFERAKVRSRHIAPLN